MSDLIKKYDENLSLDFDTFLMASGLGAMVLVSLLTNKAAEGESLDNAGSRTGLNIGSELWKFKNKVKTDEILAEIDNAIRDSLEWLISENIASEINVKVYKLNGSKIKAEIQIARSTDNRFKALWDEALSNPVKVNPYGDQFVINFQE